MLGRIAQRIARSAATRGSYCSGTSQTALGQPDSAACAVFSLCRWHSSSHGTPLPWHATTILAVRKGKDVVVIGDGQVSAGPIVVKPNARKVRRVGGGKVIAGFAGTTADAFTLMERLETHLEEYPGQLLRASVEMAKQWRTDRYLRHLEAMLIACDENISLCISGNGDVIEPHDGLLAIGSGGNYALAAARALSEVEGLTALDIAKRVRYCGLRMREMLFMVMR